MKKDMSLEGLRWSCDSGSALYDTPPNGRSRTGWGIVIPDDKTTKIEFYRFIPKYFFKLNPIPNNPRSI
jgi:hypothetical protein